jgi:hypothetical protein
MRFTWKGQTSLSAYPSNTRPETNTLGPYPSKAQNYPETVTKIVLATIPRLDRKRNVWIPGSAYYDPVSKRFNFEERACTTVGTSLPTVCNKKLSRPLKVWRKRLNMDSASNVTINQLNGTSVTVTQVDACPSIQTEVEQIKEDCHSKRKNGECTAIRRSAGICSKNYCTTTKEYLQKRTKTYDQNQTKGKRLSEWTYTSGRGSESSDVTGTCNKIVIKPSNTVFQQQGGVSSSARTNKLKYESVMANVATANYATARATIDTGYLNVKSQNHPPTGCVWVRQDRAHERSCLPPELHSA